MKLSISWIFDHIDAAWRKQDIGYLVSKFNQTSAEIEGFYKVKFDLNRFVLCKIEEKKEDRVAVFAPEWGDTFLLPIRPDLNDNFFYMICRSGDVVNWASLNDFNQGKDGLLPAIDVLEQDLKGNWKKNFEDEDIIIEVDNKSITHRPDMWGHRGFAREIAAFMDLPFLPADKYLAKKPVITFDKKANKTKTNCIGIKIDSRERCKRFSGLYFSQIENRPSNPFIVSRLLKVGCRPINGIVDLSNYLTFDWSQPVHAYDACKIEGENVIIRKAKKGEAIRVLDGAEVELTTEDLLITDEKKPLCLAGIMGGLDTGVSMQTEAMFFESANFDSASIRRSCLRHKFRTESSMRFEKTLDPNQNVEGILRFLFLLDQFGINFEVADEILSVGIPEEEITLDIDHEFFEKRSGIKLTEYDITIPLEKLEFKVVKNKVEQEFGRLPSKFIYSIKIPTFRSSKDIHIKEDILEEIIRFYGFDRIEPNLPVLEKKPKSLEPIFRKRKIKNLLVNSFKMTEMQNYAFYDEQFLREIGLKIDNTAAEIINPVSIDQKRLVSSLIPGIFKNIKDNFFYKDKLCFFELANIWSPGQKDEIVENKAISGVIFEKKQPVDFYEGKSYVTDLLNLVGINFKQTEWIKIDKPEDEWCSKYQSAEIYFDTKRIGIAGKVDPIFLSKLDVLPESDAFFFELDANFLINFKAPVKRFVPVTKYQETFFDLSLLVPLNLKTSKLEKKLLSVDNFVKKTELIDFFEKEDWLDNRSLTFRIWLSSNEKTLEKSEIDRVRFSAIKSMKNCGAKLRQ